MSFESVSILESIVVFLGRLRRITGKEFLMNFIIVHRRKIAYRSDRYRRTLTIDSISVSMIRIFCSINRDFTVLELIRWIQGIPG